MRGRLLLFVCAGLLQAYGIRELMRGGSAGAAPPRAEPGVLARFMPGSAKPDGDLFYQYVDAANQVHFARSLEEVPPEWQARAGRVTLKAPSPTSRGRSTALSQPARAPAARHAEGTFSAARSQERGPQPQIEIYTTKSCGDCRAAMTYMNERGLEYTSHDIESEPEWRDELLEKTHGRKDVPVIDVDGDLLQGWNKERFETALASWRQ